MTIEQAIKVLETLPAKSGEMRKFSLNPVTNCYTMWIGTTIIKSYFDYEVIEKAIEELSASEDVMGRVVEVTGNCVHRHVGEDNSVIEEDYSNQELIVYALSIGMKPEKMMGEEASE